MKRFSVLLAVLAGSFLFPAAAEPDNGKFLPTVEFIVPNHVYFELGGGLNFPMTFFNQGRIAMTGIGGNGYIGAGYNWSGWLFGLEYFHDQWGQGKGSYALMQNFKNNIAIFRLRRVLSQNSIHWLPSWLEIVPGAGIGVNFITTDYYPSKRAKEDDRMNSVSLFDKGANCLFYGASLELAFFLGTDMMIPFAGVDYDAFYDTSIGGGFAGFSRIYLGVRTYPLGIITDVQRHRAAKKRREEAAKEALLAAEEQKKRDEQLAEEEKRRRAEEEERLAKEEALRSQEERAKLAATWEKPAATLTASPDTDFTPDNDGIGDSVRITPGAERLELEPEHWEIEIRDPQNHGFRHWSGTGSLPESVIWDGRSDDGELTFSRNVYTVHLTVVPAEKDRQRTGMDSLTATTAIQTGILMQVIIPEKQWKIIVNTIHFDADKATFNSIPREQQEENRETLDSIARQIKLHGSVSVLIEGYANNVTNTQREDREELIPLSNERAKAIQGLLMERGLPEEMLTATGKGGANPIAAWEDRQNWWKNRRVEFIVTKNE
ncbi:MAG: OmpA family protein [Treponema sp.]|nr:OmpA family protein [Treponema sp.]